MPDTTREANEAAEDNAKTAAVDYADGVTVKAYRGASCDGFVAGARWQRKADELELAALRAMKARAEYYAYLRPAPNDNPNKLLAQYILEGDTLSGGGEAHG